jgi:hypothetical protein
MQTIIYSFSKSSLSMNDTTPRAPATAIQGYANSYPLAICLMGSTTVITNINIKQVNWITTQAIS